MYAEVKTRKQQKAFQTTWEYFCRKYGWFNDPYAEDGIRYILLSPESNLLGQRKSIGTIEFIPYHPSNPHSTVEGRCRFSQYEDIAKHQRRTWEIDKVCISEEYQRKGYVHHFMPIFYEHAMLYQPKYYLSFMEKKFYRMLRISFGLALEQRGREEVGPNNRFVPVVFDVERILDNQDKVRELLRKA